MAIQFNLPNIARRTMPEETGIPDYGSALSKGLDLGYKSQSLANKQIAEELANRISTGKAKYAMQQALADLQNTQAQTGHLGAQTRGLNIENKYAPERLSLANQIQRVKARYAEDREKNEIQHLISGNRLTNQQADELGISNKTLGEKLRIANQIAEFKANNPLLYTTGIPQQLGGLKYAMEHPELNGSAPTGGQNPLNIEMNYPRGSESNRAPLDMEVNTGRNYPVPKPSRIRESSIPSIGNRFTENEAPEVPYEQLSKSVARAFHAPNESRIPSIGRFFEEPNYSQLNNIPMIMSMMGGQQNPALASQLANIPALMSITGNQRQPLNTMQQQGQQGSLPENMSLADIIRQSMLPKTAKGALSTLAKLQGERQNIEQGRYPGSLMPIENQQKQQALLKENEAQINSQIYGKGGKDEEKAALDKEFLKEKIEEKKRLAKKESMTPQEQEFAKGLGKYGSELYKDAVNTSKGLQNQGVALDALTDAAENNPEFKNVTGRINQPLANWFGTPEQKQLLGTLQSASGEIALQVAPALKGSFTGRDQTLINTIKASPNDFPDVFIGKLKAQKLINQVLQQRSEKIAENLEKGIRPLKALQLATQETPLEKFKPQIDQLIKHTISLTPDQLMKAKLELARRTGAQ